MTSGDKVRLAVASAASVAAIVWFVAKDELVLASGVAFISAVAAFVAGRSSR